MKYIHGYSDRESKRLQDQSFILEDLLHTETWYPPGSSVLEAGCGTGSQTRILARRNPSAHITSIDSSDESLAKAKTMLQNEKFTNVYLQIEDILNLSLPAASFDHVFVCFVLEHISDPLSALLQLKRVLKPGGSITVIEGDHGSCFWSPETEASVKVWNSLILAQKNLGHDPLVGRRLYPLLKKAEFEIKTMVPKWVYTDSSDKRLADGIVNKIIVPMIESAKAQILTSNIVDLVTWEQGINDLIKVGKIKEGTFFYTWFKALAYKDAE
jgi:ubiquinone/menaquinone biosynthesis C-methylase UbiE